MKMKFTLFCFIATVFLSACSKETFYFAKGTGGFGPYQKTQKASAPVNDTESYAVVANDIPASKKETADATLTASVNSKPVVVKAKPALVLPKSQANAEEQAITSMSKVAQIKTAIKVKKELKKVIKQAEKKEALPGADAEEGKSQLIALILAALVGVLGIHRFYLGYTGIGVAQLLTAGGCGVWALIDLIRIITGDLKPKDGDYTEKL